MAEQRGVTPPAPRGFVNDSGQRGAQLPPELQGWSWAGFLMGWIWAIRHRAWMGLAVCLGLPGIGSIIQGVKGNEWAWQGRRWDGIQQFRDTQRVWVRVGMYLLPIKVLFVLQVPAILTM